MEGKSNKGLIVLVIILLIGVIGLGGYIVYDKVISKDNTPETENKTNNKAETKNVENDSGLISTKTYNADDYVKISDFEYNSNCVDCSSNGIVKKIEFIKLPSRITTEFLDKHNDFINPPASEVSKLSNSVIYETYNNILSVYTTQTKSNERGQMIDFYSLNVNLDNEKIITNNELLKEYNINITDMYKKILEQISENVKTEFFLKSTNGDVQAEHETLNEFKNNIPKYVEYINNRDDIVTLYVNKQKLNVVYDQAKVLKILGLGTHMGIGLDANPQTIELD